MRLDLNSIGLGSLEEEQMKTQSQAGTTPEAQRGDGRPQAEQQIWSPRQASSLRLDPRGFCPSRGLTGRTKVQPRTQNILTLSDSALYSKLHNDSHI